MIYKAIGWTRYGSGKGDVSKYHLKQICNTITSLCGGGIESKMWKDVCPCIRMNDYKCPMNCLIEYDV